MLFFCAENRASVVAKKAILFNSLQRRNQYFRHHPEAYGALLRHRLKVMQAHRNETEPAGVHASLFGLSSAEGLDELRGDERGDDLRPFVVNTAVADWADEPGDAFLRDSNFAEGALEHAPLG